MHAATTPTVVQRRIAVAAVLCVAAFALVGFRLVDVMLLNGRVSGTTVTATSNVLPSRADLLDRNGELLARDLPVHDLYAQPRYLVNKEGAARALARATGASEDRLDRILHSKYGYVLVARQISPDTQSRVMSLGLPGLQFAPAYKRYYPKGRVAGQLVGATDPDGNGLSGLEYGLNKRLRTGHPGEGVRLSIDMRVQYALTQEVEKSRKEFHARAGGAIVMNVNTGEILGLASLPNGAPGVPNYGANPMRNRMAGSDYELGSVFKIFAFAMALDEHTLKLDEMIPIGKGYKIGRHTIHDAEKMPPYLTARDVLGESSNIGTAQIVLRSGGAEQKAFLQKIGLLQPVVTQLPQRTPPIYPSNWGDIETATIGFGQGISVTPISYVRAAAEMVNGGRAITPTFLYHPKDGRGEQLISPETSAKIRNLLRYVVTDGTGKNADVPGYDVGGKTGSAQVPGPHGRYLGGGALTTSFCAIFPADKPRYLVFVLLDRPRGTKKTFGNALAGVTAAPLAGRVIARIAPMLGVAPVLTVAKENSQWNHNQGGGSGSIR
jgi:cell division protein FtsI (penicillin-binding protein 3)